MRLDPLQLSFCKTQGLLFERAVKKGYDSKAFIDYYMNSETAANFDLPYDRTQWCGEAYLLEEIEDYSGVLPKGETWDLDTMFWIGYTYRYWQLLKDTPSKEIYKIADASLMRMVYPGYHTLDCGMAIDRLIEGATQQLEEENIVFPEI